MEHTGLQVLSEEYLPAFLEPLEADPPLGPMLGTRVRGRAGMLATAGYTELPPPDEIGVDYYQLDSRRNEAVILEQIHSELGMPLSVIVMQDSTWRRDDPPLAGVGLPMFHVHDRVYHYVDGTDLSANRRDRLHRALREQQGTIWAMAAGVGGASPEFRDAMETDAMSEELLNMWAQRVRLAITTIADGVGYAIWRAAR